MGAFIDLTNQRFGRLVVQEIDKKRTYDECGKRKSKATFWICLCDCGKVTSVDSYSIRVGDTTSCGCFGKESRIKANTKHGLSHTRIRRIYNNMKSRCYNPNTPKFYNHGGRGIKICDDWLGENGLVNFYDWAMKNGYEEILTLDRINNDGTMNLIIAGGLQRKFKTSTKEIMYYLK